MQRPEPSGDLDKDTPYFGFFEGCALLLVLDNPLVEVSVVCVLHDNPRLFPLPYMRQLDGSSIKASL